ncbi:aminoglycoside phosphotransferase, partial [Kineococcus sp. T13]|nr:aminoglycoside phosphotransferase [Kineococcus vitellinus]
RALPADLAELARRLPALLDRLDELPQVLPHGDASPQNLLQPSAEPRTLVAVDIAFQGPVAVGFDLGQLLVGAVHAGELPAAALAHLDALLVPAHLQGLRGAGLQVAEDDVRTGYRASLLARSGFTSLPLERLREPLSDVLVEHLADRVALTRWIADAALEL